MYENINKYIFIYKNIIYTLYFLYLIKIIIYMLVNKYRNYIIKKKFIEKYMNNLQIKYIKIYKDYNIYIFNLLIQFIFIINIAHNFGLMSSCPSGLRGQT